MNKSLVFVGSIRRFDYCVQAYFPGLHTGDIPVDTHPAEVLIPRKQSVPVVTTCYCTGVGLAYVIFFVEHFQVMR